MDDLLTLLEKEDEELVEEVVIPAHFDLVQHIASILGQTKPMKTAGNDYTMNIVLAQLHDKIGPNNFAEIIKKENPLPVVCFREIALARDWKKSKSDFPESIKAYAALFAEHVAQAEPAED
ncbi:hypothetical protein HY639_02525, partial [Candidatus Woesearchaeota archaeon]|nr:hypothetical protein [Candidatus Woesearchaeota archaeon]